MRRLLLATGAALTAGALLAGPQPVLAMLTAPAPAPVEVPDRYLDQQIRWQPCFAPGEAAQRRLPPGSERLECGSFSVPRDWVDPQSQVDLTIAVSRLRPLLTDRGSLFTNPGGPGGAGRTLPLVLLQENRLTVLNNLEVVGIDVRGTGGSTDVSCDGTATTGLDLDPRDRGPGNTDRILDAAEFVAKACQTAAGQLGPFITTEQTVRDLDLLRHLLGREKIDWLGYSGGSWLGAYYATYFPDRVDNFVLDSNTEFTAPWQQSFSWQPLGFQRRFEVDFLRYAARYDAVFRLGSTPQQVSATYEDLRARLAEEALGSDEDTAIYATDLDLLLIFAMYSKTAFQPAAEQLVALRDMLDQRDAEDIPSSASAAAIARLSDAVRQAREDHPPGGLQPLGPDAFDATFFHVICNDTRWIGDRQFLLAEADEQGRRYPLLGWSALYNPCHFWDRPSVDMPTPTGAGVPPVLMVQSQRDAATPVEGALRARAAFAGSRLLSVRDEGDHGIYALTRNACVDETVESYLVDGTVPAGDQSCPGQPIPPPTPRPELLLPGLADALEGTALQRSAELAELAGPLPT